MIKRISHGIVTGIVCISVFSVSAGFVAGAFAASGRERMSGGLSEELFKKVQMFADAITLIRSEYIEDVEVGDLIHGAIRGMVKTLDGYSQFLDEDSFQDIKEETKGEFGGIGVTIGIREGVLTIITPMEGAPAFKAGIEAGDKVVKINDKITRDLTLDEAVRKLRGEPETEISVTIMRDDGEIMDFTMIRDIIKLESIKASKIVARNIGYIRLTDFQERTARDVSRTLTELKEQGAKGIVIDLRNNPGGLLDAAIETAELFLPEGSLVVYTEGRGSTDRKDFISRRVPAHEDLKMVILVNKGSASASEILAGALQDSGRAVLVGEPTFGKGSVQTVIPLRDLSALRLTTAAYYTPSGRNLMDKGIEPDIKVKPSPRRITRAIEKEEDDKKTEDLFEKLERRDDPDDDRVEKDIDKETYPYIEDDQKRTAVNILEGIMLLSPPEKN